MKILSPPTAAGVQRALAALALSTAASASFALPVFTLDPTAVGLDSSGSVTADNIIISDYSTVMIDDLGNFTDTGFLSFSNFQLDNQFVDGSGLNSTYGLYIQFEGTGTQTAGANPNTTFTSGNFDTLTYTVYGYSGDAATFGFDGSNTPTISGAAGAQVLASGELIQGTVSTSPTGASFSPNANLSLTFNVAAGAEGFFADPNPFYNIAFSAFTNTPSQVEAFDGGFRIRQGGGSINFDSTAPIPEPGTYALMLAGLAAVGTVVRRRRNR